MKSYIPESLLENTQVFSRMAPALAALALANGEAQGNRQIAQELQPNEEEKKEYNDSVQGMLRQQPDYQQSLDEYMAQVRETQEIMRRQRMQAIPRAPAPGGPPPGYVQPAQQPVVRQPAQQIRNEEIVPEAIIQDNIEPIRNEDSAPEQEIEQEIAQQPIQINIDDDESESDEYQALLPAVVEQIDEQRLQDIERAAASVNSLGDQAVQYVVRLLLYASAHGDALYRTALGLITSIDLVKYMLNNYREQEIVDRDDIEQEIPMRIEEIISRPTPPQCVRHVYLDPQTKKLRSLMVCSDEFGVRKYDDK